MEARWRRCLRPQPGNVVRLFSIAAAGSVTQAGGQDGTGAAAWASTDHAATWKTAGFSAEPSGVSTVSGLIVPTCSGCSGTVAVGFATENKRRTAAAWVASAPSATFERQQSDAFPTDGGSEISAVAETAKGLIAVGCGPPSSGTKQGETRCGFPGTNENEATLTGDARVWYGTP